MRVKITLLYFFFFVVVQYATAQDTWTQKTNLTGIQRAALIAFSIDTFGYVGFGYNFSQSPAQQTDLWRYSPASDTWTQMTSFPTGGLSGASAFSVAGKGYVVGGFSSTISDVVNELWEYNPVSNVWMQKTSCPCAGRDYAVAFSINGKGYYGTGYDAAGTNFDDFYEYSPVIDTWLARANVPGSPRSSAVGFSIGNKGYIGSGYVAGGVYDFWQFNPQTNSWIQKADIGAQGISDACGYATGEYGYICTGYVNSNVSGQLMEYDTLADTWTLRATLTGPGRSNSVGFAIGNKGYVSCGNDVSFSPLNDLWEYTPNSIVTSVGIQQTLSDEIEIYPNPASNQLAIYNSQFTIECIEVFDTPGQLVFQSHTLYPKSPVCIDISQWKSGVYFVRIKSGNSSFEKKFIKQ